jgi:hypothetical protein
VNNTNPPANTVNNPNPTVTPQGSDPVPNNPFNGKGPVFDYTPDPNKERLGNQYTGPKNGNASGYPSSIFESANKKCDRYIDSIGWNYGEKYKDETGKFVFLWSLTVIPSQCSKEKARNPTPWESWAEVVDKAPLCTENIAGKGCNKIWDQVYNTSQYWSMYNQYVCHTDFASYQSKKEYNLEPNSIDVGYTALVSGWNGRNAFGYECNAPFKK